MLPAEVFHKFLLLLPVKYPNTEAPNSGSSPAWDYDNLDWGTGYPTCNGYRQSPIHLRSGNSITTNIMPLKFMNYNAQLAGKLTLVNTGYTVDMAIPDTVNGGRPTIYAGLSKGIYEAQALHFHWGADGLKGSEHMIDNQQYDIEMHIVHKNKKYATIDEAKNHVDGIAVLGVMFEIVDYPNRVYPGVNKIFQKVPLVEQFNTTVSFNPKISLGQLLGDIDTKEFFTYKGSLTTPPCSEAVTWHVFADPLRISYDTASKFWNIMGANGQVLEENFRPVQSVNKRAIFYKVSSYFRPYA